MSIDSKTVDTLHKPHWAEIIETDGHNRQFTMNGSDPELEALIPDRRCEPMRTPFTSVAQHRSAKTNVHIVSFSPADRCVRCGPHRNHTDAMTA